MIIQCEQCRTKFKLDDEKVSDRGVKVRCAKCRHVFTVRKQSEAPVPAFAAFETSGESVTASAAPPPETETFASVPEPEEAFSFGDISFSAETPEATPAMADFGERDLELPSQQEPETASDFSPAFSVVPEPLPTTAAEEPGFSFDDIPQPGTTSADSFDFSAVDFEAVQSTVPAPAAEADSPSPENFDFSTDSTAGMPDAPETAPTGSSLTAAPEEPATRQPEAVQPDSAFKAPVADEEAPPLSISSRRRQGSTFSALIGIITVLVVAVLGYMGYIFISDGPKALSLFGKSAAQIEDGKITVQNVKAVFIPTAAAGELLVITGDALNTYKKPRAALQLKALVFGANSQVLVTKTAYAGNQLTNEQLLEMTAEKIEAAMNNQFGDSLANLEVQPGKTIPFTIVIINPPKEGDNFGVEPAGSTVAATK